MFIISKNILTQDSNMSNEEHTMAKVLLVMLS